jgi:hypothetical protein
MRTLQRQECKCDTRFLTTRERANELQSGDVIDCQWRVVNDSRVNGLPSHSTDLEVPQVTSVFLLCLPRESGG